MTGKCVKNGATGKTSFCIIVKLVDLVYLLACGTRRMRNMATTSNELIKATAGNGKQSNRKWSKNKKQKTAKN